MLMPPNSEACWVTNWHPVLTAEARSEVLVIDGFLDASTVAATLHQLDDTAFQSQFRSFDQHNPDSGTRRFSTILLDGSIEQALNCRLGYPTSTETKPAVPLPASRSSGSVAKHRDRHGFSAGAPHTRGPTAVIYLTGGGDLVFDSRRVAAQPGRLIIFPPDTPHAFEATDPSESRAMVGPVAMRGGVLEACWASYGCQPVETEEQRIERERKAAAAKERARLLRLVPFIGKLRRDCHSRLHRLPPQLIELVLLFLGYDVSDDHVLSGLRVRGCGYDVESIMALLRDARCIHKDSTVVSMELARSGISSTCLRVSTQTICQTTTQSFFIKLPPKEEGLLSRGLESCAYLVESLFYSRIRPAVESTHPVFRDTHSSCGTTPKVRMNSYE